MNKNAIQKYAVWARNELIVQVKQRAFQYGISEKDFGDENAIVIAGRVLSKDEQQQRRDFVLQIKKHDYAQAVEEVAYTWFNRFVALRFMEVNDYLPTHIRVLSDANGGFNPEILRDVLHLDLPGLDKAKVSAFINANQAEELYRYLLLTQCNALNEALPELFERLGSYTEMLLPNNILKQDSVLGRLVKDIDEDDWKDAVQVIGWLYQYYNTEPKQAVFDGLKNNVKITKDKIPAATQLFTPDWIVRYMVENSLGRLWLESHPNDTLKANWKYYLDEAEQTLEVVEKLRVLRTQAPVKSPEDIRLIDPCMGSGHILVYAFDVLMQIYESEGYNLRDAVKLIIEKNIYGLDIDRRAYQLAYFSLMMKARQYNRRIFTENVKPQVYYPAGWGDGEEYGSLVKVETLPPKPELPKDQLTFFNDYERDLRVWNYKRLLAQNYDVVVTNPPYMGSSGMGAKLSEFVKKNYPNSRSDMFAAFIEKCSELLKPSGFQSMITMQSWMFLSSFSSLREKVLEKNIVNLLKIGYNSFPELNSQVAHACAFVIKNSNVRNYKGKYFDLNTGKVTDDKHVVFLNKVKNNHYFVRNNVDFSSIPGTPIAFALSNIVLQAFDRQPALMEVGTTRLGMTTADNNRFVRFWYELDIDKCIFCAENDAEVQEKRKKWVPYNKGGKFRKWYGNLDVVVNWENSGFEIKNFADDKGHIRSTVPNTDYYFKPCATWSKISTDTIAFRYRPQGSIFDVAGACIFSEKHLLELLAFCNSKVAVQILNTLSPTLNYEGGHIASLPIDRTLFNNSDTKSITEENVHISKEDWDSFETSWDFTRHPLIYSEKTVSMVFAMWKLRAAERFDTLKSNEEELNRIFIDIYGLQDELAPEVEDKNVTVHLANKERDVRSLISYAVGCMLGRYSLDTEGIAYAGGEWDASKYRTYIPDKDNIIPICDDEYFDDDIVGQFVDFVRVVYGSETLEENLKFIADALGGKGTPREVIRNYFLNDFFTDHCKIYQKRPIYWLFDSGKKNGFKAIVYLHRYSRDLLAKLRTDYVHEQQERYRTQLLHIISALNTVTGAERARLLKQQDKLTEQLREITIFEEKIHHLADQNIEIDLDDGVKKNYEIFADVLAKI